ncbi:11385_t:CDS:2, partial [Gigaspora margarita]
QQENECELYYQLETDNTTAIEIHCDTTYKTSKVKFELYGIVGNVEGAGFPLVYLILDIVKVPKNENQGGLRTDALTGFFLFFSQ